MFCLLAVWVGQSRGYRQWLTMKKSKKCMPWESESKTHFDKLLKAGCWAVAQDAWIIYLSLPCLDSLHYCFLKLLYLQGYSKIHRWEMLCKNWVALFIIMIYFFPQGLGENWSLSLHAEVVFLFCFPNHFHMQSTFIASCTPWLVSWGPRLLFVVKLVTVCYFILIFCKC